MPEGRYNPLEFIAASKGTKTVTGSYSGNFRGFVSNSDLTKISALASITRNENGTTTANADVLAQHIEGGVATILEKGVTKVCQQTYFTGVTVDAGQIEIVL